MCARVPASASSRSRGVAPSAIGWRPASVMRLQRSRSRTRSCGMAWRHAAIAVSVTWWHEPSSRTSRLVKWDMCTSQSSLTDHASGLTALSLARRANRYIEGAISSAARRSTTDFLSRWFLHMKSSSSCTTSGGKRSRSCDECDSSALVASASRESTSRDSSRSVSTSARATGGRCARCMVGRARA